MNYNRISSTTIDTALWHIQRYLMERYGYSESERDMDSLRYYVNTGRASSEFLIELIKAKPFMVGRILHKGGTTEETIGRLKTYFAI